MSSSNKPKNLSNNHSFKINNISINSPFFTNQTKTKSPHKNTIIKNFFNEIDKYRKNLRNKYLSRNLSLKTQKMKYFPKDNKKVDLNKINMPFKDSMKKNKIKEKANSYSKDKKYPKHEYK